MHLHSSTVLRQTARSWSELMELLQLRSRFILRSLISSVGILSSWKVTSQKSSEPMVLELQCQHCRCWCSCAAKMTKPNNSISLCYCATLTAWPQFGWLAKAEQCVCPEIVAVDIITLSLPKTNLTDVRLTRLHTPTNLFQPPFSSRSRQWIVRSESERRLSLNIYYVYATKSQTKESKWNLWLAHASQDFLWDSLASMEH